MRSLNTFVKEAGREMRSLNTFVKGAGWDMRSLNTFVQGGRVENAALIYGTSLNSIMRRMGIHMGG